MQTSTNILRACGLAVALPFVSDAAIIEYEATGTFTNSDFSSAVGIGDSFTCRLRYDDSVTDSDARINTARFNDALIAFQFTLNPGALGSYSGGSLGSQSSITAVNAGNADWIYIFSNQGFGSIAGNRVVLQFYLLDYSHSSSINDLGSGQTLGSVLGGTIDLNEFLDSHLTLSAGKSSAIATISSLSVVPEPSSVSLCLLGMIIIGVVSHAFHRRRLVPK